MKLNIKAEKILDDIKPGDSIAVNGVCLTVTHYDSSSFTADVMPETVKKTNLRNLKANSKLNLERAMTPSTRMGGHIVTGHIDGPGILVNKISSEDSYVYTFEVPPQISKYMVDKGSVAVDGVSLTIIEAREREFDVGLIPHSAESTILGELKEGHEVNIEADIIAKYVEKFIEGKREAEEDNTENSSLTLENLRELGY